MLQRPKSCSLISVGPLSHRTGSLLRCRLGSLEQLEPCGTETLHSCSTLPILTPCCFLYAGPNFLPSVSSPSLPPTRCQLSLVSSVWSRLSVTSASVFQVSSPSPTRPSVSPYGGNFPPPALQPLELANTLQQTLNKQPDYFFTLLQPLWSQVNHNLWQRRLSGCSYVLIFAWNNIHGRENNGFQRLLYNVCVYSISINVCFLNSW